MTDHYYRGEQMDSDDLSEPDYDEHPIPDPEDLTETKSVTASEDHRDKILEKFKDALYDDNATVESHTKNHGDPIPGIKDTIGARQELVTTIEVARPPGFVANITIEHEPKTIVWGDDEPEYEYEPPTIDVSFASSSSDEHTCEGCDRPWDMAEWTEDEDRSWGNIGGGETYYQCPTEDCPGLAYVGW